MSTQTIEALPVHIQRVMIDRAIKEKTLQIEYEGVMYTLPTYIQLSYYCKKCERTFNARIFSQDILDPTGFATTIKCSSCHKDAVLQNKSIPIALTYAERLVIEDEEDST